MIKRADISECGRYRYSLERVWGDEDGDVVTWVMLNPSTADADSDDPTIRRCMDFSKAWGYSGMAVVNLFAWRATDPAEMKRAVKPVGPRNDEVLLYYAQNSHEVIVAWGAHGAYQGRGKRVLSMLRGLPVSDLGWTGSGQPKHPLYLAKSSARIRTPIPPVDSGETTPEKETT